MSVIEVRSESGRNSQKRQSTTIAITPTFIVPLCAFAQLDNRFKSCFGIVKDKNFYERDDKYFIVTFYSLLARLLVSSRERK